MLRGAVERIALPGPSLEGNALGDPSTRELLVYLPPSYATDSARRFPLVMVLTGYASTNVSLLGFKPWEPNFLERYERLLEGDCPEAILVMPDCFTRLGGSQFVDSAGTGDYQRYLVDDVLAHVDGHFRTLARPGSRAIVGKSSGGFGALRMGLDRPEVFGVLGSHAGDSAFDLSLRPRFAEVASVYERFGGVGPFVRTVEEQGGPRGSAQFYGMEIAALAAAYAPVEQGSGGEDGAFGALPFDLRTAQLRPEIWQRWLAHDPLQIVQKQPEALEKAALVFLDAGRWDEYGLQFGARMLADSLRDRGVRLHHEEFDGGHMGTSYRYDVSLPILINALEAE